MRKMSALDKIRREYESVHPPKPVEYSEAEVQKSVILHYEKDGWIVNKIIQCTNNGWPDLECYKNGITLFIECKATGKKPEDLQLYRHKLLRDAGFTVKVIDTKI